MGRWRGNRVHVTLQMCPRMTSLGQGMCCHFLTVVSWVVWNGLSPVISTNRDAASICKTHLPKCEFLGHASKQPVRGGPTICHTKNLRMSQSITGGQSQVISLRLTTMYAYNSKTGKIRVKVTEQIHCEFKINPSGLHKNTDYILDSPSWPILIPIIPQRPSLQTTLHQGLGFQHLCLNEDNKYSGHIGGWEFPRTKPRHRLPNGKHLLTNKLNFENYFKGLLIQWNIKNSIKNKNKIIKF